MNARRVVIAGAGFAGLALAIALKRAGNDDFVVLERGSGVGGVWRDNRYPGAAADIPTPLYSYSFTRPFPWSDPYAPQADMLAYLRRCVDDFGLAPHLRFGQRVVEATHDEAPGRWRLRCEGGETWEADVFVPAVGLFNDPVVPDFPGCDTFAGPAFHSAAWRDDVDLRGLRVAVVGSGASAVQIVPALEPSAASIELFQRTPGYVMAKKPVNMADQPAERERLFRDFDALAERRKRAEQARDPQRAFADYLATQVGDPALRDALTPPFPIGCKRSLFSNDWYAALQSPKVRVHGEAIEAVVPGGLRTRGGEVAVDAIVWATGFNASRYFPGLQIVGRGGRRLEDAWRDGAEAHLGISVAGFPNLFILYGPNTNVAGSVVHMHECQVGYIRQCLEAMRRRGARAIEVRADVMRRSCDEIQSQLRASVQDASRCTSYAMTPSGRIVTNYPGSQSDYALATRELDIDEYDFA